MTEINKGGSKAPVQINPKVKQMAKKLAIDSPIKIQLVTGFEEEKELEDLLRNKLAKVFVHCRKVVVDWRKEVQEEPSRQKRRERVRMLKEAKKLELIKSEDIRVDLQKFLVVGFNRVVRQVQGGQVGLVLVDSRMSENILRFLLPLCRMKEVRVLGLVNLEPVARETMGFRCSMLGLTREIESKENFFHQVWQVVEGVWQRKKALGRHQDDSKNQTDNNIVSESSQATLKVDAKVKSDAECEDLLDKADKTCVSNIVRPKNTVILKRGNIQERTFVPIGLTKEVDEVPLEPSKKRKTVGISFPYYESILL